MSSPERDEEGSRDEGGPRAGPVVPLYARLPHGPHRLGQEQVVRHQRARIHGAMVEAVAEYGYAGTSVRQVVALAGVSRRSFYEQFANKEECFLATYDVIATRGLERIGAAHGACGGSLEDRLRAGFNEFTQGLRENWKGGHLVIVDAQTAGPAGLARLRRTTAACERMLSSSFALEPEGGAVALPLVRAIVGGLHWIASLRLRKGDERELPTLAEEMLDWTLLLRPGPPAPARARAADPVAAEPAAGEPAAGEPAAAGPAAVERAHEPVEAFGWASAAGDRERVLEQALRLALLGDYRELSAPQIADEAGVSLDVFLDMFAGRDECFLAALDMLGADLRALADDPGLRNGESWPQAVRRVMAELMRHLGEHPLYAQTIAAGAFAAGPQAAERARELMRGLTALLVAGAPQPARSGIVVDAIVGAIGHTIRCRAADGQIELLATASDDLAYVVLAPFLGAEAAAGIVSSDQPLLALAGAAFGEIGEHDADEQRHADDDDERGFA